jgi:hypothetical protein
MLPDALLVVGVVLLVVGVAFFARVVARVAWVGVCAVDLVVEGVGLTVLAPP